MQSRFFRIIERIYMWAKARATASATRDFDPIKHAEAIKDYHPHSDSPGIRLPV